MTPYEEHAAAYATLVGGRLDLRNRHGPWWQSISAPSDLPRRGWKLHVSATVLSAAAVLGRCLPVLDAYGAAFKVPAELDDLARLNSGVRGSPFRQIGKFLTVYPTDVDQARRLAVELDRVTAGLPCPAVPGERRLSPESCVFYRYGPFVRDDGKDEDREAENETGGEEPPDPFSDLVRRRPAEPSPLSGRYCVFRQVQNRGSGGVYLAFDLEADPVQVRVIKEGRLHGEVDGKGRDGRWRLEHERRWLVRLPGHRVRVPPVLDAFEVDGNGYLVLPYLGPSLYEQLRDRTWEADWRARVVVDVCELLARLHAHGIFWRDLHAGNVVLDASGITVIDVESMRETDDEEDAEFYLAQDAVGLAAFAVHVMTGVTAREDDVVAVAQRFLDGQNGPEDVTSHVVTTALAIARLRGRDAHAVGKLRTAADHYPE